VLTDEGFYACTNKACGIIYTDMLDLGAEWRFYGSDDNQSADPTRCGMPVNPLLKESSYGFKILRSGKSSSFDMAKIARYMDWQSMPYNEKALYEDFKRISIYAEQGGIPKLIIDDAMRFHSKFAQETSFRGLNRDGIIAATIYIAARTNGYPRTAKEIASIFHLDNTSATRGCRNAISKINDMEHDLSNDEKTPLGTITPQFFIERYCSKLCINVELTALCMFVAFTIESQNMIPENTPDSIAAGIVYFVAQECKLNVSKHNVQAVSQISQVTINKCYKKMVDKKEKLLPPSMVAKYANM
jgi:transcription initiation factor TFIIIB Brf1 subunit/transcription initiation factor TFIIB